MSRTSLEREVSLQNGDGALEDVDAQRSRDVEGGRASPSLQPEEGAPEWARKVVSTLGSARVRAAIVSLWVLLALGGLACLIPFMAILESSVPPCPGTAAYIAQDAFTEHFPAEPINGAFLIKSTDGQPLVTFGESTCKLAYTLGIPSSGALPIAIGCKNTTMLGDGCITMADFSTQAVKILNDTIFALLPSVVPDKAERELIEYTVLQTLAQYTRSLPNITACPRAVPGGVSEDWLKFTTDTVGQQLNASDPGYINQVLTFASLPDVTITKPVPLPPNITAMIKKALGIDVTVANVSVTVPSGEFWQSLQYQFLTADLTTSLVPVLTSDASGKAILPSSPFGLQFGGRLVDISGMAPASLDARASSMGLMLDAVQAGVDQTMFISFLTVPVALLILAYMVQNLRLVIVTVVNLGLCVASALLFMYPISMHVTTATTAPSMMLATALAMSIDYSLFLLTRFQTEISAGKKMEEAVAISLATSGRIVLVSGVTLLLCFLAMLCLPVAFIYSMGIAAALTVGMAVLAALTFTPTLLLSFPVFFMSNERWGLSTKGLCCSASTAGEIGSRVQETQVASPSQQTSSRWTAFGTNVQKFAWVVALALLASMIPVALTSLPRFQHSVGLLPMMPSDSAATQTVKNLQDAFGVGAIFPTQLVVVPPSGATATSELRKTWLNHSCAALKDVAINVNKKMQALDADLPAFTASAFLGPMILEGRCAGAATELLGDVGGIIKWSKDYAATVVVMNYQIDPFSPNGAVWIKALRDAVAESSVSAVAKWHVLGQGPNQIDAAALTFERLPMMVGLMMAVVFGVIAIAFGSAIAPLRAVFCLSWMLVITFGFAIFVFQDGALNFLHWSQLGSRIGGGMSWMSPSMAFPVAVGIGLDYDIFYSERVVEEWKHGYSEREAAVRALTATANIISAAGVIMIVAFFSLLVSTTPTLNEIAFILIVGISIDCFITTKVVIPCAMALLQRSNFWPRRRFALKPEAPAQANATDMHAGLMSMQPVAK